MSPRLLDVAIVVPPNMMLLAAVLVLIVLALLALLLALGLAFRKKRKGRISQAEPPAEDVSPKE